MKTRVWRALPCDFSATSVGPSELPLFSTCVLHKNGEAMETCKRESNIRAHRSCMPIIKAARTVSFSSSQRSEHSPKEPRTNRYDINTALRYHASRVSPRSVCLADKSRTTRVHSHLSINCALNRIHVVHIASIERHSESAESPSLSVHNEVLHVELPYTMLSNLFIFRGHEHFFLFARCLQHGQSAGPKTIFCTIGTP